MKSRLLSLIMIGCVLSVFLVPIQVLATEFEFTTTGDFDAGTYSTSSGNREINSNSCNLGIGTGAIELDSLKGDSFCIADADADTFKWVSDARNGPCATLEIAAGVYNINITSLLTTECVARSSAFVSGDIDVRIRVRTPIDGSSRAISLCLYNEAQLGCNTILPLGSATVDGLWYRNLVDTVWSAFTVTDALAIQIGLSSDPACEPAYMRITRISTTVTFLYSCNGTTWTTDETATFTTSSNLWIYFSLVVNGLTAGTAEMDDVHLANGLVSAGGFRSSGTWRSAAQASTTEQYDFASIRYSGVSSTNYVTTFSLINGIGSYVFIDSTDITSGTQHVYSIPDIIVVGPWSVEFNFTGDGSGTPSLESVMITTSLAPGISNEDILMLVVFLLVFSFLFILGTKKHPMFYILCGIIGIAGAIVVWGHIFESDQNAATILITTMIGLSSMIIVMGFTTKMER